MTDTQRLFMPSKGLMMKLAALAWYADCLTSTDASRVENSRVRALLNDDEVKDFLDKMVLVKLGPVDVEQQLFPESSNGSQIAAHSDEQSAGAVRPAGEEVVRPEPGHGDGVRPLVPEDGPAGAG